MEDSSSDIDRRAQSRVGSTIGERWRLTSLLGVGGMAAVYAAERVGGDGPEVAAIKMLHPEFSADSFIRKRFVREGYVANAIAHPGAVEVFDNAVAEDGSLYLEMELLDGMTLDERCDDAGHLPADEVIDLVHQLLSVLEDAHGQKILHRDLKPENLFLTVEGELKVLDFGIARMRQGDGHGTTQTGDVMGTPLFMAPEQARGRWDEVDARTDLWAVGAVAFTLLAGRPVHLTKTSTEALVKVVTEPVVPLGMVAEGLPSALTEWVDHALAFDKEQRFTDATEMRRALENVSQSVLSRPPAARIAYRTNHPLSGRNPSGRTAAMAGQEAEHAARATPASLDEMPTLMAATPSQPVPGPRGSGPGGTARVSVPDAPVTPARGSAPSLDAVAGPPSDSLSIPTRRTPWALVGACVLLLGGGLAVVFLGAAENPVEPRSTAVQEVAPPTPEPEPAPQPAPEPSTEPAPEPSTEPRRALPSPAAVPRPTPAPSTPDPSAKKSKDDPYGRRH